MHAVALHYMHYNFVRIHKCANSVLLCVSVVNDLPNLPHRATEVTQRTTELSFPTDSLSEVVLYEPFKRLQSFLVNYVTSLTEARC